MQTYATNDGFGDNANLPREFDPWIEEQFRLENKRREENAEHHRAYSHWETENRRCVEIHRTHWTNWKNSGLVPCSTSGSLMPWRGKGEGRPWGYVFHFLQITQRNDMDEITQHWHPNGKKTDGDHRIEHKRYQQEKTKAKREYNIMLHSLCPWWCPKCGGQTFPGCGLALLLAPSQKAKDDTIRIAHLQEDARRDTKNASRKTAYFKAKMEAAKKAKVALSCSADKSNPKLATAIKVFETAEKAYVDANNAFEKARASLGKILREAKDLLRMLERQRRIGN